MEGLDLLKKDWKKEQNFPKITETEIYKMIHKKSSSIVKWIFIISILEISLWVGLSVFLSDDRYRKMVEDYHLDSFMNVYSVIHWFVLFCFIVLFYKNFRNISNTSSAKTLMKSILTVRKIVNYYVIYNVVGMMVSMIIVWCVMFKYDQNFNAILENASKSGKEGFFWIIFVVISLLTILISVGILWLFYRVIYGILLRRLQSNYKELEKIEI